MRFILSLIACLAIAVTGCTFSPYDNQSISNPSAFQATTYTYTPDSYVAVLAANPNNISSKANFKMEAPGPISSGFAITNPQVVTGVDGGALTGYQYQSTPVNLIAGTGTGTNFDVWGRCVSPGTSSLAHSYVASYRVESYQQGDPFQSWTVLRNSAVANAGMSQEPAGCWGSNGQTWGGFVGGGCIQGGAGGEVVDVFYTNPDCLTQPPVGYTCETKDNIRVCFPEWPGGSVANVDVLVELPSSTGTMGTCLTTGPGNACIPTSQNPAVGFYQNGSPLTQDDNPLWQCRTNNVPAGGFTHVCSATSQRDPLGIYVRDGGNDDYFSRNY